jgi:hypothetical protein
MPYLGLGSQLTIEQLEWIIRSSLRESVWCKLSGPNGSYIHFSYDYYLYIGSASNSVDKWSPPNGIYAEPFQSIEVF